MPNNIVKVAIPTPLRRLFDYACSIVIAPGSRVLVPFGKRELVGIVIENSNKTDIPANKLKAVKQILDSYPVIPTNLLKVMLWAASYYHHPLGEVVTTGMPSSIRKGKEIPQLPNSEIYSQTTSMQKHNLNSEQKKALAVICAEKNNFKAILLKGITGSGKTEVYLQSITSILEKDEQALVLIPEIALSPQTFTRFSALGMEVSLFNSQMTDKQRLETWLKVKDGVAKVVIGTRSAIFLPYKNLKLIIIDEEHDSSFKQQEGFRYCARSVAIMQAYKLNIPIVLGSATPSLDTLHNANINKYLRLDLTKRAGEAREPEFELLDIRHKKLDAGLSAQAIAKIKHYIERDQQVLLFLNRRGYAPVLMCFSCSWTANCSRCDAKLTLHQNNSLVCHHCGKVKPVPKQCPECSQEDLHPIGVGTERLDEYLTQAFPNTEVIRIDSDTARKKKTMQEAFNKINAGGAKIIVGTQMLAKGHHFANLALVIILNADAGIFSADFKALESTGQMMLQVAGRAGRESLTGQVLIQTHHPDNPLLHILINQGYEEFATRLLNERKATEFPPFANLALLSAEAKNKSWPHKVLEEICQMTYPNSVEIFGPIPANMTKKKGFHRYLLLIKAEQRDKLHYGLNLITDYLENNPNAKKVKWLLDVDPYNIL